MSNYSPEYIPSGSSTISPVMGSKFKDMLYLLDMLYCYKPLEMVHLPIALPYTLNSVTGNSHIK